MEQRKRQPVLRDDLFQFHLISQVSLSPDGSQAAYVVTRADREGNCYRSSLWVVSCRTGENRMLAARGGVRGPLWLDRETILFASDRDPGKDKGEERTDYYRISVCGGEALRAMAIPARVRQLRRLGRDWLVMAEADESRGEAGQEQEAELWQAVEGEDYEIYEELPFWIDGRGIRSRRRDALYLFSEEEKRLRRITPKYLQTVSFDLSTDGTKVAYCGPVYDSVMPKTCGLFLFDVRTGETRRLVEDSLYDVNHVCFLGDDRVFYTGTTYERTGRNPRYYVYDLRDGSVRQLPFCDRAVGSSVGSDIRFGTGKVTAYCDKREVLYLLQTDRGDGRLMSMDRGGNLRTVTREPGAVTGFDVKAGELVITAMRGQNLTEVYALCPEDGREIRLTGLNDSYIESHNLSVPELLSYQGKNGFEMEGYVMRPADYRPGNSYPAVLEIHGGPKTVSGAIFNHEYQCLASDGYFVIYCNPRGSDGRGEAYADITEAFGKDDFRDFLEFTDQVLVCYPDIDPKRLGVCGGSYGGFMVNWMAGSTDRYRAAVSQRSISNYLTKCLYADAGYLANRLQVGAFPWEDFGKAWSTSPLSRAKNVKIPILFLQSDQDYKSWLGEAVQMFSAVKRQGTPTRLVLFHGENHDLSRSGRPANRVTRLKEIEEWFEEYLR